MRSSTLRRLGLAAIATVAAAAGTVAGANVETAQRPHRPASWMGFGPDRWPDEHWRPYADHAPFNQPVGRARTHPRSRQIVARLLAWGAPRRSPAPIIAGSSGTADDYGHPVYYATRDDPRYRLVPAKPWGRSEVRGRRIRIPAAARPAPGTDGHMTVVQPDGWEYDFWQVRSKPRGGGTLRFSWGGRLRIDGSGLGGRATAASFGALAGIIRAPELAAGRIDHALFAVVSCTAATAAFGHGARVRRGSGTSAYVYPARGGGARCPRRVRDAPPMGARLHLAMSDAEIDALGLPAWRAGALRALARYGAYIGDTGGPGFAFQLESGLSYLAYGRPDPLVQLGRERIAAGDEHVREHDGRYLFDLADGIDWAGRLRVVLPPR